MVLLEKFLDMGISGLFGVAAGEVPTDLKRRLKARVADFNPFATISANHDLKRAVRVAWIEAAREVIATCTARAGTPEWLKENTDVLRYAKVAEQALVTIRQETFKAPKDLPASPIDAHFTAIVEGTADYVVSGAVASGEDLTGNFTAVLAGLTGDKPVDVPALFGRVARDGVPVAGNGRLRDFGELVLAAFADVIKSPDKYPEAGKAFEIAMAANTQALGEAVFEVVRGIDGKLDATLARLDPGAVLKAGAREYLELLPAISEGVERVEGKLDDLLETYKAEADAARKAHAVSDNELRQLLAVIHQKRIPRGDVGPSLEAAYEKLEQLRAGVADMASLANEEPEIAPLIEEANKALETGDHFSLDKAEAALEKADARFEELQANRRDEYKRGCATRAQLVAKRAQMAEVRFKWQEAETLYWERLELLVEAHGADDVEAVPGYGGLAKILNGQGKYGEAEPLYRKGLEICREVLGENHPDTAASYNNVASNLDDQGRFEEAEPLYRKGLEIGLQTLGENHPSTAASYNNVASNLDDQGRFEEAEPLFRMGLEIHLATLGENHPSTATSYNNVASNLDDQGRFEEAEPLYRKDLDISLQSLGENHPDTATSYNNVAYNLYAQGRFAEAEPLLRKAVEIFEGVLGAAHPHSVKTRANLEAFLAEREKE